MRWATGLRTSRLFNNRTGISGLCHSSSPPQSKPNRSSKERSHYMGLWLLWNARRMDAREVPSPSKAVRCLVLL